MSQAVLIVDDNEADRYLLARLLRRGGVAKCVIEAQDGIEALEFFSKRAELGRGQDEEPKSMLVFLDINMPRMNGFEFLDAFSGLGSQSGYASVVIVMWTSSDREEDRTRALAYPFVKGLIVKMPQTPDDLVEQLAKAIPDGTFELLAANGEDR